MSTSYGLFQFFFMASIVFLHVLESVDDSIGQDALSNLQSELTAETLVDRVEIMRRRIRSGECLIQYSQKEQDGGKALGDFGHRFLARFDLADLKELETELAHYNLERDSDILDVRSLGLSPIRIPPGGRTLEAAMDLIRKQIQSEPTRLEFTEDRKIVWLECSNDTLRTRWQVDLEHGFTIVERTLERGTWDVDRQQFSVSERLEETQIQWKRISNIWLPTQCVSQFTFTYKPFGPPDEPLRSRKTHLEVAFQWKSVNEPVTFQQESSAPFMNDLDPDNLPEPIK